MNHVLITIVNYANEQEVLKYSRMLSNQTIADRIHVVITINKLSESESENFYKQLDEIDLDISTIDPQQNLGYLNGSLAGYRHFRAYSDVVPKWVVISNTDISIEDDRFFEKVMNTEYPNDIWSIGPSVYSQLNDSYDNPHYVKRISLSKVNRVIWIHRNSVLAFAYSVLANIKSKISSKKKQTSQYVYSNHGCFMILHNDFMQELQKQDYPPFLYSEESYVAEMVLRYGKKSYYDSNVEIVHQESTVTSFLGIKKKSRYIADSMEYIKTNFYV